jgi:hypothetical protein
MLCNLSEVTNILQERTVPSLVYSHVINKFVYKYSRAVCMVALQGFLSYCSSLIHCPLTLAVDWIAFVAT